ncbi:Protein zds1 OS=Schizosaccharomyces pombe (strain 972 / ATCC 24843) GN=zds1 PE=1 SV=2 [Rhizoctonia solani AG-1 IB]|uniref:Protein zds1 n=1 Tax=Thanatephorus cucumeris (strain AG1-IB / isolate 7/3/14) TaxID=1108050 RepID=A0A0B7FZG7_THACB|nr:Protein zds1 OS=Schizosaccharomyces pombe (strain 972 / ATCC 24843) GN=zds1 PE=1 SV=2 [Rhizoctonia solani AG-1 IB]
MSLPTRRSGEQRGDEEGYWDAIGDEEEGPHLFWVPAHLHPEIAPSEFRAFLKEHARAASDEGHEGTSSSSEASSEESADDKPLPFPGPARALSTGVTRKKSMLSRQYKGTNDDDDEPQPVRRSRTSIYGGPQLTINDLQKIDELAQDADPAKLRAVLRRILDKADALPDNTDEADSPIIVPRPGQILRRAARTKIRKPNLPGDGGGHRFASTRRAHRTNSASTAPTSPPPDDHRSESDHTTESEHHAPPVAPALAHEDDWHSDRPMSYTDESTIFDAYADRRDSMTSLSDEAHNQISVLPLDLALGIPAPAVTPTTSQPMVDPVQEEPAKPFEHESASASASASEPVPASELELEPELHHPAPQRHLVAVDQPPPERTPSPGRSHSTSASPASSDLHLPQSQSQSQPQSQAHPGPTPPRKEKKGGLFGMGKKSKKDKDSEKETGFFGSLFGGSKSKKADDSNHTFSGGQAAAVALLGASKSKSPAPPNQPINQPVIQPSANGTYARYPIHVERAVYRLSHIKLANPRRPLYEQVLISNLMFWYLGVINKQQQEEKERAAAEKEREERERKDKEKEKDGKAGKGKAGNGGARKAEMPVRGPQYEMQNRQMAEEYTQQQRPASAPPADRQYHLPARQQPPPQQQQRVHSSGDAEFGYSPQSNGAQGLPPGAMAPQVPHSPTSPTSSQTNLMNSTYTGGSGPYPAMNRPKSAGKGSTGSLGSKNRREASEDDTPLNQLGGSLGRRGR